jgi:hypothetical protein
MTTDLVSEIVEVRWRTCWLRCGSCRESVPASANFGAKRAQAPNVCRTHHPESQRDLLGHRKCHVARRLD